MNIFTCTGRLVKDIEVKSTKNGIACMRNTIAIERPLKKEDRENKDIQNADFITFVVYGQSATFLSKYSGKGKRVALTGRMQSGKYTDKEGIDRYTTELLVDNLEILDWKEQEEPVPF